MIDVDVRAFVYAILTEVSRPVMAFYHAKVQSVQCKSLLHNQMGILRVPSLTRTPWSSIAKTDA